MFIGWFIVTNEVSKISEKNWQSKTTSEKAELINNQRTNDPHCTGEFATPCNEMYDARINALNSYDT